jgi:hypothetical protein
VVKLKEGSGGVGGKGIMARSIASTSAARLEDEAQRAIEDAASMAGYISDMASELAALARHSELPMVAYFLELARVEADMRSRELGGRPIARHG